LFEKEYAKTTAADRRALAGVLLVQGRATRDDAAARYVALSEASELAAAAGDADTALAAVDDLGRFFAVDALELRRTALAKALGAAATAADAQAVMRGALETAEKCAAVDAFDAVPALVNLAEAAANKTKQVRVVAGIQEQVAELRDLAAEFARVKAAFVRVAAGATDDGKSGDLRSQEGAEAELVIGRFYAMHKGQWELGLSHLAAGSDSGLARLAARELARPADGVELVALGDAWWDVGQSAAGREKRVVLAHAREIYARAQKAIAWITLARIESRMGETAGNKSGDVRSGVGGAVANAVDLLALVDVAKDAAVGKWSVAAGGVQCENAAYACVRLPWVPAEEYDLHVTFTRQEGTGPVAVLLAGRGRQGGAFGLALDVKGEARLEQVNGKVAKDNPTVVPVAVSNGRRYELVVEVRKDRVGALLDGKRLLDYKTDGKDLTRYSVWKLGDTAVCGVGAKNARVVFEKVEMVEVTGKGRGTR